MAAVALTQGFFKLGSTWRLRLTRKDETGEPIDLDGLVPRAMFRQGSVDGSVIVTLTEGDGLTISDPVTGSVDFEITPEQSVLFAPNGWVYFDVEMTDQDQGVWQSQTYRFKAEQEVTRD